MACCIVCIIWVITTCWNSTSKDLLPNILANSPIWQSFRYLLDDSISAISLYLFILLLLLILSFPYQFQTLWRSGKWDSEDKQSQLLLIEGNSNNISNRQMSDASGGNNAKEEGISFHMGAYLALRYLSISLYLPPHDWMNVDSFLFFLLLP